MSAHYEIDRQVTDLSTGLRKSMPLPRTKVGDRYGTRVVAAEAGRAAGSRRRRLILVRCDCGREDVVYSENFRRYGTCLNCRHRRDLRSRFDEKWIPEPNTGCWLWVASVDPRGYGRINIRRIPILAHRVAYELHVGAVPEDLVLDHLCRTPGCVNPAHLEPVTQRENVLRGTAPPAKQSRQTHCRRGHLFDKANTRVYRGKRLCRTCSRERAARKRRRAR